MKVLVRKRDRFRVREEIHTEALVHLRAPYTAGCECTIPKGTVLVVDHDPLPNARGFGCIPEDYEAFEAERVPESWRKARKYEGVSFVFERTEIGQRLEPLQELTYQEDVEGEGPPSDDAPPDEEAEEELSVVAETISALLLFALPITVAAANVYFPTRLREAELPGWALIVSLGFLPAWLVVFSLIGKSPIGGALSISGCGLSVVWAALYLFAFWF